MAAATHVILEFLESMEDRIESLYEATRSDPVSVFLLDLMSELDHTIARVRSGGKYGAK